MIHIAALDDNAAFLAEIERQCHLFEKNSDIDLNTFTNPTEFLAAFHCQYDILFMDIEMPGIDGFEAARRIRERDDKVSIIFVTNMVSYAPKGYSVNAMDFIVKPVSYYRLAASLTKARSRLQTEQGVPLVLHTKDGTYRLDSARVHYIEMLNHHTIFHTEDGVFDTTGSLKKLEEQLAGQNFARCNNGYLVNLRYVRSVEGSDVVVGGDRLLISRTRRKAFLQQMSEYFGGAVKPA